MTAIKLYLEEEVLQQAKREFDQRRDTDFEYEPLIGDWLPSLDYKKNKNDCAY